MDEVPGAGVYSLDTASADWYHLGYLASGFQAEIFAVLRCFSLLDKLSNGDTIFAKMVGFHPRSDTPRNQISSRER